MKQHITVEQLNELSDKQKKRLQEWWKPQDYDLVIATAGFIYPFPIKIGPDKKIYDVRDGERHYGLIWWNPKRILPLLSIGQMIELLGRKIYFIMPEFNGKWLVRVFSGEAVEDILFNDVMGSTLCNALWQAVKEVL